MTYIPLHHKYRPQTFSQLVGQAAIATTLSNALLQNRIAPAYLFTGARGTGKTSSARIFAKSLNCISVNAPTDKPCGHCQTCQEITRGNALDVIEIDAASNTGVDNIRELIERSQFAPVQCRYKVYVIDECLTGDTLVLTRNGLIRIDNPKLQNEEALSYNEKTQIWEYKKISGWVNRSKKETLRIKTQNSEIRCTGNHLIRTEAGWIPARDVREGMKILSPVPAVAETSSTNMEPMGDCGDSIEDINFAATPTVQNPTAWTQSWNLPNLCDPIAPADAVKNLKFQLSSGAKARGSDRFRATGNDTRTLKNTDFGKLAPKSTLPHQDIFHLKPSDLSMAHCWEMPQSSIPMRIADTQDSPGRMENYNKAGCSISLRSYRSYSLNLEKLQIEDTATSPTAATQSATQNLWTFSRSSTPIGLESKFLNSGCKTSRQKEWLGGTWTMTHSALAHKDLLKFKSTQKDSQRQKIDCWQNGLRTLATPLAARPIREQQPERDTTISGWEQTHLENGSLTCSNSPVQQWVTSLETVESVRPDGVEFVYDIEVEDNHNFVANGLTVHNCHMLTSASFNALLKTLEEPPEQVVFILATTDPQRVLPTIISRCQRFDFRRIPIDDMTQHLSLIADKEQIPIADDALYLIAQISQGGLRDAESLLDQLSLLAGDITVERVWDLVGAVPEQDLMALIEAIAQNHPEAVLDTTRRLMDRGREPLIVLQNLASFYRDLLIAKTAPDRGDLVALTSSTWTQLCEFVKGMSITTILAGQQRLKESELQLKSSTQPRLWLEVTLMGLLPSSIPSSTSIPSQSISQPISQPATPAVSQPISNPAEPIVETTVASPVPESTLEPVEEPTISEDSTDLDRIWQTIISNLQPFGTQALLKQHGDLVSFDGDAAQISIPEKLLPMAQSRSKSIATALTKTFGKEVKFSLVAALTAVTPSISAPPVEPSKIEPQPSISPPPEPEPAAEELSQEPYSRSDWDDDEVTRAARTLAEAFNGSVVDADDAEIEPLESSDQLSSSDIAALEEPTEEDDEDDTDF